MDICVSVQKTKECFDKLQEAVPRKLNACTFCIFHSYLKANGGTPRGLLIPSQEFQTYCMVDVFGSSKEKDKLITAGSDVSKNG